MSVNSQDIVLGLISYYKNRGVDLTALLGDPTFQSLKASDKIEAIKTHAAQLYHGSSNDLTAGEKSQLGVEALWTAGLALPAAYAVFKTSPAKMWSKSLHNASLGTVLASSLVAAGLVGAAKAGLDVHSARSNRKVLRSELYRSAVNPSTENAVGVLASSNVQRLSHPARAMLVNRVQQLLDKHYTPGDNIQTDYANLYNQLADDAGLPQGQRLKETS